LSAFIVDADKRGLDASERIDASPRIRWARWPTIAAFGGPPRVSPAGIQDRNGHARCVPLTVAQRR
jgi:hypothetical protein